MWYYDDDEETTEGQVFPASSSDKELTMGDVNYAETTLGIVDKRYTKRGTATADKGLKQLYEEVKAYADEVKNNSLPAITSGQEGYTLRVNASGKWATYAEP